MPKAGSTTAGGRATIARVLRCVPTGFVEVSLMGAIEPWHLIIVLVVVLLVLGPKRLPEAGRSLGETIREFRKATSEMRDSVSEAASPAATDPVPGAPARSPTGTSGPAPGASG
jgi:sec-independent protein translocase protein TatA